MSSETLRRQLIDQELRELVILCIEEEDNMSLKDKELFLKNKTKILSDIPSRIKTSPPPEKRDTRTYGGGEISEKDPSDIITGGICGMCCIQ